MFIFQMGIAGYVTKEKEAGIFEYKKRSNKQFA